jgi:hypothetical protein
MVSHAVLSLIRASATRKSHGAPDWLYARPDPMPKTVSQVSFCKSIATERQDRDPWEGHTPANSGYATEIHLAPVSI